MALGTRAWGIPAVKYLWKRDQRGLSSGFVLAGEWSITGQILREMDRNPFPDESFDALMGEFFVFPTPTPTGIGQPGMARALTPGMWQPGPGGLPALCQLPGEEGAQVLHRVRGIPM